jgi:hypothetical protein
VASLIVLAVLYEAADAKALVRLLENCQALSAAFAHLLSVRPLSGKLYRSVRYCSY